jgi:hypothetical protein
MKNGNLEMENPIWKMGFFKIPFGKRLEMENPIPADEILISLIGFVIFLGIIIISFSIFHGKYVCMYISSSVFFCCMLLDNDCINWLDGGRRMLKMMWILKLLN